MLAALGLATQLLRRDRRTHNRATYQTHKPLSAAAAAGAASASGAALAREGVSRTCWEQETEEKGGEEQRR